MSMKMKTKALSVLLCFVMLIGLMPMTALAAENAHAAHSSCVTHVEASAGNCTTPGNIEFWYCDYYTCEKCYTDEAMTVEIAPKDTIITPGVHSDACVGCNYAQTEKTFELFVPAHQPDYDEDFYFWSNGGFHRAFGERLLGRNLLFVGEGSDGKLYAMSNVTNEDGSRQAVDLSSCLNADGTVTVNSDTAEFFTYHQFKNIETTYTFSADNGYMAVMDGEIVVRGQNIETFRAMDINDPNDDLHLAFPQAIRFEQDKEMSDYDADSGEGYLFSWSLDSGMLSFDAENPSFVASNWSTGDYSHSIMLYVESCDHSAMKHTPAVAPTCTEDGTREYWYCDDCKLYYADGDGSAYLELPDDAYDYESYLRLPALYHNYGEDGICVNENCGRVEHQDAEFIENVDIAAECFEPGRGGYWYCEECGRYLDENKEKEFWEERDAAKRPATGHAFNLDTGVCDHCGLSNPVYSKVTSFDEVNEEDLYIFVAEAEGQHFVLGGLNVHEDEETGDTHYLADAGNAVPVTLNGDGTISLLNQTGDPNFSASEFMLDITPEQFDSGLSEFGLTTVMLKLPNHCVYPFQSYSRENNGYMGVTRYGNGEYGQWDSSDWIIDFYTTEVTEDTFKDGLVSGSDEEGLTHAEQLNSSNIGNNVAEGNVLLYKASFVSVGGAMFTLRLRNYDGQYYFIAGEDWPLEGAGDWDPETGRTYSNDTQYAVWLYRSEGTATDIHRCDFGDWVEDEDADTHTRTCKDSTCGKTETEAHGWGKGTETKAPTCSEEGIMTYTCGDCGATKTEAIAALDHEWSSWTDDGANTPTDTHSRSCRLDGCIETEQQNHSWGAWTPDGDENHKKTCSVCSGTRTAAHAWDGGVITTEPTEDAEGVKTYTCGDCGTTKTESVDKVEHQHSWSDWVQNDEDTHIRSCRCNKTETEAHHFDEGVVVNWATHIAPGEKHYTCEDCGYLKSETLPALAEHEWGSWHYNDDGKTHTRACICNETETADCSWDNGVVTTQPNHFEEGIKTYTCAECSGTKTETLPKSADHLWSDWGNNNDGKTHIRECKCGEIEQAAHEWDNWRLQDDGSHSRKCTVCEYTENILLDEDEPINTTPSNNAAAAVMNNTDLELIDMALTDEEQSQLAAGASVSVYLLVEDITDTVSTTVKAAVEGKAAGSEIGMYLDIDLLKKIQDEESAVRKTDGMIEITITVPDALISNDESVTRSYKIIRTHDNGEGVLTTDVIDAVFDPATKTLTFLTDKFSTYALAYQDGTPTPPIVFDDVPENIWYTEPVYWAVRNGITDGYGNEYFGPNDNCTRAQAVTFLWRVAGCPAPSGENPFTDVPEGEWYTDAIVWAAEVGITDGYSNGTFGPNDSCTRAHIVTFLWRFKGTPAPAATNMPFTDVPAGQWYTDPILWAAETGITDGYSNGLFGTNDKCTRAQIVTFLHRAET